MKSFTETEIKYLAGLMDADGCLSFRFTDNYCYLELSLAASESIDKHGYVDSLGERAGSVSIREYPGTNWSPSHQWRVSKRSELNMLLPRIIKHMVVKGKHWNNLFTKYTELKATLLTDSEIEKLKTWSSASRKEAGPLKPKNHPTWAWTAGFLDGDGYYSLQYGKVKHSPNYCSLRMGAVCHKDDRVSLDLLHKAFGGNFKEEGDILRWYRNLGPRDKSFAVPFLQKVHAHSKLKKWKIEQMLAFHNNQLQRLTEK